MMEEEDAVGFLRGWVIIKKPESFFETIHLSIRPSFIQLREKRPDFTRFKSNKNCPIKMSVSYDR